MLLQHGGFVGQTRQVRGDMPEFTDDEVAQFEGEVQLRHAGGFVLHSLNGVTHTLHPVNVADVVMGKIAQR